MFVCVCVYLFKFVDKVELLSRYTAEIFHFSAAIQNNILITPVYLMKMTTNGTVAEFLEFNLVFFKLAFQNIILTFNMLALAAFI